MLLHFQELREIVTSNSKNFNTVFFPGLNQAPESFIFSNPNVKYVALSFNKKARPNLKDDCERIVQVFKENPHAHFVAHSLAALLIEWLIQNRGLEIGERVLTYVAPAFYPKSAFSKIVKAMAKGPVKALPVPSLAPIKTRVRSYVELRVYQEILLLNEEVDLKLCHVHTVVDARDEMLNIKYLKNLSNIDVVRENRFPHHRAYQSLKNIIN